MDILALSYTFASLIQIAAGIPQICEIIKQKDSKELSLLTWFLWFATQALCLGYVIAINDYVLIAMCCSWLVYYVAIIGVILYYRLPRKVTQKSED